MSMLWQRVLTASILAIIAVYLIFFQSTEVLSYAFSLVILVAAWEWARLAGVDSSCAKNLYAVLVLVGLQLVIHFVDDRASLLLGLMAISVTWWLIVSYRLLRRTPEKPHSDVSWGKLLLGFLTLIPAVMALLYLHDRDDGHLWMFYCISMVWIADIGAYFSGRRFGRHKLAPRLSPGKTREGLYGAVAATLLYTLVASRVLQLETEQVIILLVVGFIATLISVTGDLFISLLKRERGIKDSGHILPGHGGVLDRIDSITSAAPFFALTLGLLVFNG